MSASVTERAATFILAAITRRKFGIAVVLMPAITRSLGPVRALHWMATNMPKYDRAVVEMGPVRAHLMCTVASLLNGCAYCTYAHGRALELHYFQQHEKLFSMDAHRFIALASLEDEAVLRELETALAAAGIPDEMKMVRRLYALKLEGAEPRPEDRHLVQAIKMFDVLNSCAIESLAAIDDAHDLIQMDPALKLRYANARLEAKKNGSERK
jgi:AhpD family alkylhydroperoxidase